MGTNLGCVGRRVASAAVFLVALSLPWGSSAHDQGAVAFPIYSADHALQGIYTHHYPALWQTFAREAADLTQAAKQHCANPAQPDALLQAWRRARLAWMAASHPAVGPVVTLRSQREIDFWPVRPALLQRALSSQPQSLAQMARVGGPAKGFPTMELLLSGAPAPTHCPYHILIAQGIEAHAQDVNKAFSDLATKDWNADDEAARNAFAEWINQWLGGLTNLSWQHIAQPLHKAQTAGTGQAPQFARRQIADNRADWLAQWSSLQAQARLTADTQRNPPVPGMALVPIEALLLGKGHIALAQRWAKAIDAVTSAMASLPERPTERELQTLSQTLKTMTSLYQSDVAAALDVPLGFSSADGD